MKYDADEPLAMILPIPVREGSGENAVDFLPLDKYERFFDDMHAPWATKGYRGDFLGEPKRSLRRSVLKVHDVGNFEASFVPTLDDMDRLDKRFTLPRSTWQKIPQYENFGFVVFKLKDGAGKPHPMAFAFPSASDNILFFPTVHIHDGEVHAREEFDHDLYAQFPEKPDAERIGQWSSSGQNAGSFMKPIAAMAVDMGAPIYMREIEGMHPNEDVLLKVRETVAT